MTAANPTGHPGRTHDADHARQLCAAVARIGDRQLAHRISQLIGVEVTPRAAAHLKWLAYWNGVADTEARYGQLLVGDRWIAWSYPAAAKTLTKQLKKTVTPKMSRTDLERLHAVGALLRRKQRFDHHATWWYRPDPAFLAALLGAVEQPQAAPADVAAGQVQGRCRAGAGQTRGQTTHAHNARARCRTHVPAYLRTNSKSTTGLHSLRSFRTTCGAEIFDADAPAASAAGDDQPGGCPSGPDDSERRTDRLASSRPAADAQDVTEGHPQPAAQRLRPVVGEGKSQPARESTPEARHAHVEARFPDRIAMRHSRCPFCGHDVYDQAIRYGPPGEYEGRWLHSGCFMAVWSGRDARRAA